MKVHKREDVRQETFTAAELAEIDRLVESELLRMNLRALRSHVKKTQVELAARTGVLIQRLNGAISGG